MTVATWTTNSNLELPTLTLNVDYTVETSKLGKVEVFCYKPKTDSASNTIKAAIVKRPSFDRKLKNGQIVKVKATVAKKGG